MRRIAILLPVLAVVSLTVLQLANVSAADGERPRDEKTPSNDQSAESVDVRYAWAYLELAKLDLRRALESNKQISNLFSVGLVVRLRQNVSIAEEQLKQNLRGDHGNLHHVHLRSAESAVQIAETEAKKVSYLHEKMPTKLSAINVQRSRAAVKVARLGLERARDPRNFESVVPHLQWQIEELREQVLQLQLKVDKLSNRF